MKMFLTGRNAWYSLHIEKSFKKGRCSMVGTSMMLDTRKFTERLLTPSRFATLVADTLIGDGRIMRLGVVVQNKKIEGRGIDAQSLPTLNLEEAGIEVDRREDTIRSKVNNLLLNQRFTVEPDFDFITGLFVAQQLTPLMMFKVEMVEFQARRPLFAPDGFDPQTATDNIYKEHPLVGIKLVHGDETIRGLDLSRVLRGSVLSIVSALYPPKEQVAPANHETLQKVLSFYDLGFRYSKLQQEYDRRGGEGFTGWSFRLFQKKKFEKMLTERYKNLEAEYGRAKEALDLVQC